MPATFNSRTISNPSAFRAYEAAVASCTRSHAWSPPQPLSRHCAAYRSESLTKLPWGYFDSLPQGLGFPAAQLFNPHGPFAPPFDPPVSSCVRVRAGLALNP